MSLMLFNVHSSRIARAEHIRGRNMIGPRVQWLRTHDAGGAQRKVVCFEFFSRRVMYGYGWSVRKQSLFAVAGPESSFCLYYLLRPSGKNDNGRE